MSALGGWRPVLAIAGREVGAAFGSAAGWTLGAVLHLIGGVFWVSMLAHYVTVSRDQVFNPFAAVQMNTTEHLVGPWLSNLAVVLLVVCPAVSMRLYAEELRRSTMELLLTSPVSSAGIVAGKFLGALTVVLLLLGSTAWMPLSVGWWVASDLGSLAAGYLGLSLFCAAVLGVGSLCSAMTDSPLLALVLTFALCLCLWVIGWMDPDPTSFATQLSLSAHLRDLMVGAVRRSDVAYFLLLTGWSLFATWQRVESWRYL